MNSCEFFFERVCAYSGGYWGLVRGLLILDG